MAASCEGDKSITQRPTPPPLSSEVPPNAECFLKARKKNVNEGKCHDASLEHQLTHFFFPLQKAADKVADCV